MGQGCLNTASGAQTMIQLRLDQVLSDGLVRQKHWNVIYQKQLRYIIFKQHIASYQGPLLLTEIS